jgi:hypothetical protein
MFRIGLKVSYVQRKFMIMDLLGREYVATLLETTTVRIGSKPVRV